VTETEPRRPPRSWDFILTLVLILVMFLFVGAFALSTLTLSATNLACVDTGETCSDNRVQIGQLISTYAPAAIALIVVIVSVVRLVRRRVAFWVPIVGIVLMSIAFAVGTTIRDIGIPEALS